MDLALHAFLIQLADWTRVCGDDIASLRLDSWGLPIHLRVRLLKRVAYPVARLWSRYMPRFINQDEMDRLLRREYAMNPTPGVADCFLPEKYDWRVIPLIRYRELDRDQLFKVWRDALESTGRIINVRELLPRVEKDAYRSIGKLLFDEDEDIVHKDGYETILRTDNDEFHIIGSSIRPFHVRLRRDQQSNYDMISLAPSGDDLEMHDDMEVLSRQHVSRVYMENAWSTVWIRRGICGFINCHVLIYGFPASSQSLVLARFVLKMAAFCDFVRVGIRKSRLDSRFLFPEELSSVKQMASKTFLAGIPVDDRGTFRFRSLHTLDLSYNRFTPNDVYEFAKSILHCNHPSLRVILLHHMFTTAQVEEIIRLVTEDHDLREHISTSLECRYVHVYISKSTFIDLDLAGFPIHASIMGFDER